MKYYPYIIRMNGKQGEGVEEEMEGLMGIGCKHCLQQTNRLKQGKIDGYSKVFSIVC